MKKIFAGIFPFIMLTILLISCSTAPQTKEQYLKSYESFVEDVKKNKEKYSDNEWKKADEKFSTLRNEMYEKFKGDLTTAEELTIGKYEFQYNLAKGGNSIKGLFDSKEVKDALGELKNILSDTDIKKEFNTAFDELKKVWDDDLKDELGAKLDEVKSILEDEDVQNELSSKLDDIKDILNDKEIQGKANDILKSFEGILKDIEDKIEEK